MIEASLYLDWKSLCLKIKNSIKNRLQNEQSNIIVCFGKARVEIRLQTYERMVLSSLIQFQIFGKDYKKGRAHTISK